MANGCRDVYLRLWIEFWLQPIFFFGGFSLFNLKKKSIGPWLLKKFVAKDKIIHVEGTIINHRGSLGPV
jgi:hypothetical protein